MTSESELKAAERVKQFRTTGALPIEYRDGGESVVLDGLYRDCLALADAMVERLADDERDQPIDGDTLDRLGVHDAHYNEYVISVGDVVLRVRANSSRASLWEWAVGDSNDWTPIDSRDQLRSLLKAIKKGGA